MTPPVFAYILHKDGVTDDTALEMMAAAQKLNPEASIGAIVAGSGAELEAVCQDVAASYAQVWKINNEALAYINAEVLRGMLVRILPQGCIVLIPYEHFGMDLAPGLSIKLNVAYLPDAVGFEGVENGKLKAIREEYSGQVSTHVLCDVSKGAVITVRPGSFAPDESKGADGQVIDKTAEAMEGGLPGVGRRYLEVVAAEVGDVDITKSDILVSVGRGIEDQDNLEMVFDLAKAMGAEVSCSRPIVDAKWLEKARQVGTSGKTVKPKVYMALGISGSFQHIGGIKGSPFIVAVNKNSRAPIFQIADVGVVADILDFVPELTDKINEMKG
ncbi:MAG: electron transfer flavoprotein subunit alpha/FixB family protein [Desulfobacterales bacterium]|uniref:Electron transfer flavoprotein subunit alpha/FixB family protein n=1 Tax=Candidatus Desulfatibia profunda TaxID=2841695 RepID=A0A8J6TIV0_9BACT|nr:electron transfer flavoprotein subunit alpha/FixB family protein [Candidatus Desulfatibia profunda]MBL7178584.1 electron transfer flavoprotein subunit alpha/FixB family protein [Desulfobacterales bacterium]